MERTDVLEKIRNNVERLCDTKDIPPAQPNKSFPSTSILEEVMLLLRTIVFPGFFGVRQEAQPEWMPHYMGVYLEKIYDRLQEQVYFGLCFETGDSAIYKQRAIEITLAFIDRIPHIKRLLNTDAQAILEGDPAAQSLAEVVFSYPATVAILHQRAAHVLYQLGVPVIPRIITEIAHSKTGIDIHPGASIGEYFSIDHGSGVVVGETAVIGNHVRLYQGVTLGAKGFTLDANGRPLNLPRHPIIQDHVTIYSNASILGNITIGTGSVIGGNVWLVHDVPPHSKIVQGKTIEDK